MVTRDRLVRLSQARDQLRDIGCDALTIDDIARNAAMSRFHFVRQFKAVFGETPIQCRGRARLDRAKHLLLHGQDSVTDICMAVGFSSLGSFSTRFAERYGRAPSLYREHSSEQARMEYPDCLTLLRLAWVEQSQISRSATEPSRTRLRNHDQTGSKPCESN